MEDYSFARFKRDEQYRIIGREEVVLRVINFKKEDVEWQEYDTSVLDCSKYGRVESLDIYIVWKLLQEFSPIYKCSSAREIRILYLDFMIRNGLVSVITPTCFCRSFRGECLLALLSENPPKPQTAIFPQEYNQSMLECQGKWDHHTGTEHKYQRWDSLVPGAEYNILEGTCRLGAISGSSLRVPCLEIAKVQDDKNE